MYLVCVDCQGSLPEGRSPRLMRCDACKKKAAVKRVADWREKNPEQLAVQREKALPRAREYANKHYHEVIKEDPERLKTWQEQTKVWREANPEKVRASIAKWRANPDNKPKMAAWAKAWWDRNTDKRPGYWRKWYIENLDAQKVRALKRAEVYQEGDFTYEQWEELLEQFNNCCAYCLVPGSEEVKLTMDHMDPLTKGGRHTLNNIVPACQSCNSSKNNRSIFTMLSKVAQGR